MAGTEGCRWYCRDNVTFRGYKCQKHYKCNDSKHHRSSSEFSSFVPTFVRSFQSSFVRSFQRSFVRSNVRSFVPKFVCTKVRPKVRSFGPTSVRPSFRKVRWFVPQFVSSFVPKCSCVHSLQTSSVRSSLSVGCWLLLLCLLCLRFSLGARQLCRWSGGRAFASYSLVRPFLRLLVQFVVVVFCFRCRILDIERYESATTAGMLMQCPRGNGTIRDNDCLCARVCCCSSQVISVIKNSFVQISAQRRMNSTNSFVHSKLT